VNAANPEKAAQSGDPWDGHSKPFTIGMRPIDEAAWIDIDAKLDLHLAEKQRLEHIHLSAIFREMPETREAQNEVRELIVAHLVQHCAAIVTPAPNARVIKHNGMTIPIPDADPPLLAASRMVQEDLCLMRRSAEGWVLAAAALAFPSSWSLAEKIGRPLGAIHQPVPGFAGRMDMMVTRIFDNLKVERPVERFNWSLYDDPSLHHPRPHGTRHWWAADGTIDPARVFVRTERQTLRKLAHSGDVLFTIKIRHDALAHYEQHQRAAMAAELAALSDSELAYKGLAGERGHIAAVLASAATTTT
jgi:hypothetical protein